MALALSSFGSLGSAPIQGALLTHEFLWKRPIIFSGVRCVFISRSTTTNFYPAGLDVRGRRVFLGDAHDAGEAPRDTKSLNWTPSRQFKTTVIVMHIIA